MNFTITITGEDKELTPAVQALVAALAQGNANVTVGKSNEESSSKRTSRVKPEKTQEPDPVTEPDTTEPDTDQSESESDEPVPTDVELRAKAQQVGQDAEKKSKIKALLNDFGVPNITALPDNKRIDFMKRLEAL